MIRAAAVKKLIALVDRYKNEVESPVKDNWKTKDDGQLWAAVLGQIAVVGSAVSGISLSRQLEGQEQSWYIGLTSMSQKARQKEIHECLRKSGVRYVSADLQKCRKTPAATLNFELLQVYGGPLKYFQAVSKIPVEAWRIAVVGDELSYIKNKGARDLLIGLGLVQDAIAFDSRIMRVLELMGIDLPSDIAEHKIKYKSLEREIIERVCVPCGISGGFLDRILFAKASEIFSLSI